MFVRFVHARTLESIAFEFDFAYGQPVVHLTDEEWTRLDALLAGLNPSTTPYPAITRQQAPAAISGLLPARISTPAQPAA